MRFNLLAQLRYTLGQGHTAAITGVRGVTAPRDGQLVECESGNDVILTCSSDGTVGVWEKQAGGTFQILCFLHHMDPEGQLSQANDAAAAIPPPGALGPEGQRLLFVLTGANDGVTRLWKFHSDPKSADSTGPFVGFADAENDYGVPVRLTPESQVAHECPQCKHHHAVLSLAVLPRRWDGQSKDVAFNFISGTTEGMARVFTVRRTKDGEHAIQQEPLKPNLPMEHAKETVVNFVSLSNEFDLKTGMPKSSAEGVFVATCGGRGQAKIWRLSNLTDTRCQVTLLKTFSHEDDGGKPYQLTCVGFTPCYTPNARRYLVTSSFDTYHQDRSRVFLWDTAEGATRPEQEYVFRAKDFAFWYPRDTSGASFPPYVYCITSAPDNSAKMFRILNMQRGLPTQPLLSRAGAGPGAENTDPAAGASSALVASATEPPDKAEITHIFRHQGPVQSVVAVQVGIYADGREASARASEGTYSSLPSKEAAGAQADAIAHQNVFILTAGSDKVAELWDPSNGQKVHSLRAASMSEVYVPLLTQLLTVGQLATFSFQPTMRWNTKAVGSTQWATGVISIDANALAEILQFSTIQIYIAILVMSSVTILIFNCVALFDVRGRLKEQLRQLEAKEEFRDEVKRGETGLNGKQMGPQHQHFHRCMTRLTFWRHVVSACSTVLVVPLYKTMLRFFDCIRDEGHDPPYYVERIEWLACRERPHLYVGSAVLLLLLPYLVLVVPFVVVKGDAQVVAWEDLFSPREWRQNSLQKSQMIYLGAMQHRSGTLFQEKAMELLTKVAVPSFSIMMTSRPVLGASCTSAVHLLNVSQALGLRPYTTRSIDMLFTGTKMINLWAALASILSAVMDDEESLTPAFVWYGGLAFITAVVLCIYSVQSDMEAKAEDQRRSKTMKPEEKRISRRQIGDAV